MNKAKLDKQIGSFMAITFVVLEAALLMVIKLKSLLEQNNSVYLFEAKKHFNGLKNAWEQVRYHLEYFECAVLPTMVTKDGETDTIPVYDAMVTDGYDIARLSCRLFNAKVHEEIGFAQIEELLKQFEEEPKRIDEEIIESLKLSTKKDGDKDARADT